MIIKIEANDYVAQTIKVISEIVRLRPTSTKSIGVICVDNSLTGKIEIENKCVLPEDIISIIIKSSSDQYDANAIAKLITFFKFEDC